MPITLIEQKPEFSIKRPGREDKLTIAEMFCDTLQGEGITTGVPSTFIRLQGCVLLCSWCDTLDVWPHGNEYLFEEIFFKMESVGLVDRFRKGQHLILTGGSPLKQQERLTHFLLAFTERYGFVPYIEVENEAVLLPTARFSVFVDQWNNSPKLANSEMKEGIRIKPDVLQVMNGYRNSWFKFVVQKEDEWGEIERDFLPYIDRDKIILMPEGQTQEELSKSREIAASIAIREGVRFTDRLHITIWDRKTGV